MLCHLPGLLFFRSTLNEFLPSANRGDIERNNIGVAPVLMDLCPLRVADVTHGHKSVGYKQPIGEGGCVSGVSGMAFPMNSASRRMSRNRPCDEVGGKSPSKRQQGPGASREWMGK